MKDSSKSLQEIHEDVPSNHYDIGIERNIFQRYWHGRRFEEVEKELETLGGKILDIGCHSGLFTKIIVEKTQAGEVYGIDISPVAVLGIKQRLPRGTFLVGNAQKLPFKNNFFDAIFLLEVLEHIENPAEVTREVYRVLKNNGYCLILVPTDNLLFRIIWKVWNLLYPVWKHAHVQSFKGLSMESMLVENRFQIKSRKTFLLGMLKLIKVIKI